MKALQAIAALVSRLRASPWALLLRGLGAAGALVLLAWIGRAAAAGTGPPPDVGATFGVEAGSTTAETATGPAAAPLAVGAAATPIPAVAEVDGGTTAPVGPRGRATPEDPVYLNSATVDELRRLPGVGAKRAQAILTLRQRIGRFVRIEDLLRVKGIGRGALRKWRPLVRLDVPAARDAST